MSEELRALVERLRKLMDDATPGPLIVDSTPRGPGRVWVREAEPYGDHGRRAGRMEMVGPNSLNNARLMVEALNALPALIDHLEADGMVLVPREPTEAMLAAAHDGPLMASDYPMDGKQVEFLRDMWKAYLSALPVPKENPDARS